jgi:hypothetical protein
MAGGQLQMPIIVRCDYDPMWQKAADFFLASALRQSTQLCTYRTAPVVLELHRWKSLGETWARSYLREGRSQVCPPVGALEYVSVYATTEAAFIRLADYWRIASLSQYAFDELFPPTESSRKLRNLIHGSPAAKRLKMTIVEPLTASDYLICAMLTCHLLWLADGDYEFHSVAVRSGWFGGFVILDIDRIVV